MAYQYEPYKWWVNNVLPLVYDDSLSYYEVLSKLKYYVDGLVGDVNRLTQIVNTIEGIQDIEQFTEMLNRINAKIGELEDLQTTNKDDIVSAINSVVLDLGVVKLEVDEKYTKPSTGIPESDLSEELRAKINEQFEQDKNYKNLTNKPKINHIEIEGDHDAEYYGLGTYTKPANGIPENDLSEGVKDKLNASDENSEKIDGIAPSVDSYVADRDYQVGELVFINGKLYKIIKNVIANAPFVIGNNIEETTLNNELSEINEKIKEIEITNGAESFDLNSGEITTADKNVYTLFFMPNNFYAKAGENYLFIVIPNPGVTNSGYNINVYSENGDVAYTFNSGNNIEDYKNERRFTFTPVASGYYYCGIKKDADGTGYPVVQTVKLQYTPSQSGESLVQMVSELLPIRDDVEGLTNDVGNLADDVAKMKEEVEDLNDLIMETGANILTVNEISGYSTNGVVISRIDDHTFNIYGTATAGRYVRIFNGTTDVHTSSAAAVTYIPAGKYKVSISPVDDLVKFRYTYGTYSDSLPLTNGIVEFTEDACVTLLIRNHDNFGTQGSPTTVDIKLEPAESAIDRLAYVYPDPNGQSSNNAILECLNKYGICNLVKGTYYLSNILHVPENTTIRGAGSKTIIQVQSTVGFFVDADGVCIENLQMIGEGETYGPDDDVIIPDTEGDKTGIVVTGSDRRRARISNCFIHGFSRAGITCRDIGTGIRTDIVIDGCALWYNYYGINIMRNAEYMMISNCSICCNNQGVLNRGGNNKIANCDIDSNIINMVIDNAEGVNGGHGCVTGCSLNHSNNRGDAGYSIIISGTGRMKFSNCYCAYGKIKLEGTNANVFSGCAIDRYGAIELTNVGFNMFIGCAFYSYEENVVTGNEDGNVKFIGCFTRGGREFPRPE